MCEHKNSLDLIQSKISGEFAQKKRLMWGQNCDFSFFDSYQLDDNFGLGIKFSKTPPDRKFSLLGALQLHQFFLHLPSR